MEDDGPAKLQLPPPPLLLFTVGIQAVICWSNAAAEASKELHSAALAA